MVSRLLRHLAVISTVFLVGGVLSLAGCRSRKDDRVLARAAGLELSVEDAASLFRGRMLPTDETTVITKAELWVDYVLVAAAAAEDSSLENLDVSDMARRELEHQVIGRLGQEMVQADTVITEEELRKLFLRDLPGGRVRARHILLSAPPGASEAHMDSLKAIAGGLRDRALRGEDFGDLARAFSTDPATRDQGGALGEVSRGTLVPPLEEMVFALGADEVGGPLETPFGIHLVQVLERIPGDYQGQRATFARQVREKRILEAQGEYLDEVEGRYDLEVLEGVGETVRRTLAGAGGCPDAGADIPLARHRLGVFTTGDLAAYVRTREPGYRTRLQRADDEVLRGTIASLARKRLLLAEGEAQGIRIAESDLKSMSKAIKEQILEQIFQFGFLPFQPAIGESREEALRREVMDVVAPLFRGSGGVHLRRITCDLEQKFGARIFDANARKVVEALGGSSEEKEP